MDQHKIDNFLELYAGTPFPPFTHLRDDQATAFRRAIANAVGVPSAEGLALVRKVNAVSEDARGLQADDPAFSLSQFLLDNGVTCKSHVLLNWYRFDDIDEFRLVDVDRYFSDIWYPGTDDLDIFDESVEWIVSISHHGTIKIFKILA